MKHIVFVVGNYKNGGVAMRSTNLANAFAEKGYTCTILVTKDIGENVYFERHKNVSLVSLKEYVTEHIGDDRVQKVLKKRKLKIRLIKYLRYISKFFPECDKKLADEIRGLRRGNDIAAFIVNNPDCVYIPFGISYYFDVFYGAKGTNCKIIYAERTTPMAEIPVCGFSDRYLFKFLRKADKIILQTHNSADFYKGHIDNYSVINNPLKANLPEVYNGERRKCIVSFCRVSKEKNLPLLIDSFMEFHKSHHDFTVEIYGNTVEQYEKEHKKELEELISSLNAEEYIKILPPRADVHSVVRDCTMFVSSSDFEGLSNSMIEAMAIGLPCVCTDCLGGGAKEVIENEVNGLIVPIKDSKSLCEAMCRMADDEELSRKCSDNASKIRTALSADTIADEWLKAIDNI